MAKELKHYAVEIILILAAVLIFRSAWTLMDQSVLLSTNTALWIMLIIGIAVTILAFNWLFGHEKEH